MRYYHLNIRNARLREFARIGHRYPFVAILLWLPMKLGLIPLSLPLVPRPDSINDAMVDAESLPEPARSTIREKIGDAEKLGFIDPVCEWRSPRRADSQQSLGVRLSAYHRNGRCVVQHVLTLQPTGIAHCEDSVVSFLNSGRAIGTTNDSRKFDSRPGDIRQTLPNAKVVDLLRAHERLLQTRAIAPKLLHNGSEQVD